MTPGSRVLLLAPCAALAALAAGPAHAELEVAPPPGWEAPPPLPPRAAKPPPKKTGKPVLPACCGYDETCCTRQTDMDAALPDRVARVVEVRFADLPGLVVKEAPASGPAVVGAPGVRVIDGLGRPAPWPDAPKLDVRVVPVGAYGEMTWREGWAEPFFSAPEYRGMGYGMTAQVGRGAADVRALLTGKIDFTSFDAGRSGTVSVDYVEGRLAGTPEVVVSRWGHVEAAPVTDGFVHAFRGWTPYETAHGAEGQAVTFVLPEVILGFESKDAKHRGGFLRVRGSRDEAFTTFSLPVGLGRSGVVRFQVLDNEIARWFPRPAGTPKPASVAQIALASSQTSAEAAPRVRVIFLNE